MTHQPDMAVTILVLTYLHGLSHGRVSLIILLRHHLLHRRPRHPDRHQLSPPPTDCCVTPRLRRPALARMGPWSRRPSPFHPFLASPAPAPSLQAKVPSPRPPSPPKDERALSRSTYMHRHSAHSSPTMARVRLIGDPYLRRFFSGNGPPPPIDCYVSPSPFDATRTPPTMARVRRLCPPPSDC